MDTIWYRNPSKSELIGRCGGDEKTNDHAEPLKLHTQKTATKNNNIIYQRYFHNQVKSV